jgi:hypothetical protein
VEFVYVVLRFFENGLVLVKVTRKHLHLRLDFSTPSLHVKNLLSKIFYALVRRPSMLSDSLLEISLKLHHLTVIDVDLRLHVLGFNLVALGHLAVRKVQFALYVSILFVLSESTLV